MGAFYIIFLIEINVFVTLRVPNSLPAPNPAPNQFSLARARTPSPAVKPSLSAPFPPAFSRVDRQPLSTSLSFSCSLALSLPLPPHRFGESPGFSVQHDFSFRNILFVEACQCLPPHPPHPPPIYISLSENKFHTSEKVLHCSFALTYSI